MKIENPEFAPMPSAKVEHFFQIEDNLAMQLTNETISSRSAELMQGIRKAVSARPPDTDAAKIMALQLRQLNRLSNFRNKKLKADVAKMQAEADAIYLQYNNLISEICHLKKNIAVCLDFRSMDTDIELVPLEEFYREAPAVLPDWNENVKTDPHKLHLARLNFELAQRNRMADQLHEQENRKNLLVSDIGGKENRLGQIRPFLSTLRSSAKPLLDMLGLKKIADSTVESRKRTLFLPKELKVLHLQCGVYNEFFPSDTLNFTCEGDSRAVDLFEKRLQMENRAASAEKEEDDGMDVDGEEQKARRSPENSKEIQKLRERVLQSHPIVLTITIPCGDVTVNLYFHYLPDLKCVSMRSTVKGKIIYSEILGPQNLFDDLFEDDSGERCPNEVGAALLRLVEVDIGDHATAIGKPYVIAQKVAAMESAALNADCPSPLPFEHFTAFIKAARQRIRNRLELSNTLHTLESSHYEKVFPRRLVTPYGDSVHLSALKVDCNPLVTTTPQTNYWQSQLNERLAESAQLVRGFQVTTAVECEPLSLGVVVYIPYAYPRIAPTFFLTPRSPISSPALAQCVRDFEKCLNLRIPIKAADEKADVLATQFATLVWRLPVLLELESDPNRHIAGRSHALTVDQILGVAK